MVWSSTYVRTCLAAGDVAGAAEALGRPVTVRGFVVRGDQRGRELGFPTANVPTGDPTQPAAVPPTACTPGGCGGSTPESATRRRSASAPTRPSTANASVASSPTCSTATDLELYDAEVEVEFVDRLRGMVRFDSVEELVAQMKDDVARARELLAAAA